MVTDEWDDHTMVTSKHGPEFCCRQCSTREKRYVAWPCDARLLTTLALLGSLYQVPESVRPEDMS